MKYRNQQLREALAAEYVLGVLQGRARSRFERSLKDDPSLRDLVAQWRDRLAPMDALAQPLQPPARVWHAIRDRVQFESGQRSLWTNLRLWRTAAMVSMAAALALAVSLAVLAPRKHAEMMVVVMSGEDAAPAMTVSWPMHVPEPKLRVRVFGHPEMAAGTAWELWMLPGADQKPMSLGLIGTEPTQEITIPRKLAPLIDHAFGLAMSVEPSGGSPTGLPTGPVLYKGMSTKL